MAPLVRPGHGPVHARTATLPVRTRFRPAESLDPPQRRRHDPGGARPRADRAGGGGRPRRRRGSRPADGHRVPATDDVLRPRLGPWCRDVAARRPGPGTRRSGRGDDPRPLLRRYDDRVEGSGDDRSRAPARRLQGHRRQTPRRPRPRRRLVDRGHRHDVPGERPADARPGQRRVDDVQAAGRVGRRDAALCVAPERRGQPPARQRRGDAPARLEGVHVRHLPGQASDQAHDDRSG